MQLSQPQCHTGLSSAAQELEQLCAVTRARSVSPARQGVLVYGEVDFPVRRARGVTHHQARPPGFVHRASLTVSHILTPAFSISLHRQQVCHIRLGGLLSRNGRQRVERVHPPPERDALGKQPGGEELGVRRLQRLIEDEVVLEKGKVLDEDAALPMPAHLYTATKLAGDGQQRPSLVAERDQLGRRHQRAPGVGAPVFRPGARVEVGGVGTRRPDGVPLGGRGRPRLTQREIHHCGPAANGRRARL